MNEDIEKLKAKLKKKLDNYELDKKFGQLSVDSIYSMFPTESKILLDYIEQLQNNWNELMEDIPHILEMVEHNKDVIKVTSDEELAIYSLQNKMQELEGNND